VPEPRRNPARVLGRPPSDSLLRPTHRRLTEVTDDAAASFTQAQPAASRGWLLAVAYSAAVWIALVALVLWLA
jgi:hypothetical protein